MIVVYFGLIAFAGGLGAEYGLGDFPRRDVPVGGLLGHCDRGGSGGEQCGANAGGHHWPFFSGGQPGA